MTRIYTKSCQFHNDCNSHSVYAIVRKCDLCGCSVISRLTFRSRLLATKFSRNFAFLRILNHGDSRLCQFLVDVYNMNWSSTLADEMEALTIENVHTVFCSKIISHLTKAQYPPKSSSFSISTTKELVESEEESRKRLRQAKSVIALVTESIREMRDVIREIGTEEHIKKTEDDWVSSYKKRDEPTADGQGKQRRRKRKTRSKVRTEDRQ